MPDDAVLALAQALTTILKGDSPPETPTADASATPAPTTPAAAPAAPVTPEVPQAPQIGAEVPAAAAAAIAAAGPGVPQPGQRLDSDGLTALLKNADAYAAYEDAPGGKQELDRVQLEEMKGRRV